MHTLSKEKAAASMASQVLNNVIESCGRLPRDLLPITHFFHWFERASLEMLRDSLCDEGFHCGQVRTLRRRGEKGDREVYYQLMAERRCLLTEEDLLHEILRCFNLLEHHGAVYQAAIAETVELAPLLPRYPASFLTQPLAG